jgi:hypothetical protein
MSKKKQSVPRKGWQPRTTLSAPKSALNKGALIVRRPPRHQGR